MNELLIQLLDIVQPAVLSVIEAAMGVLVPLILWKINAWMKAKTHDARFHCAMDKVTTHAQAAVLDVGQTYVKGVRKSGKWNGDAVAEAKKRGQERIRKLMGPVGFKELQGCLGQDEEGANGILDSALELAVASMKKKGMLSTGGHAATPIAGASKR